MDRTQSSATIPGQTGTDRDGNEVVLRIPYRSSITGTSPSVCLGSYPRHTAEKQCFQQPQPTEQPSLTVKILNWKVELIIL